MQHFIWGILLLPLLGFLLISFLTRLSNRLVSLIGAGSVGLAFVCSVITFLWLQGQTEAARQWNDNAWHWAFINGSGQFRLTFGLLLDPLSSVMTLVITGVGFLILVYSIGYMHGDHSYLRFFAQMNLFIFTMLLLVLANNYLFLLVGWAGVGLTSYLLIGFYYDRPSAVAAARKAFVMNVIGDWGIMVAIFVMFIKFGGVEFQTVFGSHGAPTLPYNGQVIAVLGLLLLVGAVAKSAQLPLYTWLPDAMEGPTPVSALIHAATMVTAGVYLVARSYPIYQHSPVALHTVAFIGAIGTVFAASMGLANTDIKRILAYSTMSQIAYMFVGVGVAVYSAGMFHLVEHAFFKALLFMCAGSVIHALHDEQDIRRMGGLRSKLRFTYWTFLIGVLAIVGVPGFSGFFSKEDVIGAAYARALHGDSWLWIVWALTIVTAFLTAVYMFRLFFLVFHGEPQDESLHEHAHEPGIAMKAPMAILAFLSIFGGWIAFPGGYNKMESWLAGTVHRFPVAGPKLGPQAFLPLSMVVTLVVSALGVLVAWQIYYRRSPTPARAGAMAPRLYNLLLHKWYVDEIYDAVFVQPVKLSGQMLYRFFERGTVDATVDNVARLTRWASARSRGAQSGYARNYALSILFGAFLIAAYYVVGGR